MYTIIEAFSSETEVTLPTGQILPGVCLVEDEQGLRFLLAEDGVVPASVWGKAVLAGAEGILKLQPQPSFVSSESFGENADLDALSATYRLPEFIWSLVVPGTLLEMQEGTQGRVERSEVAEGFTHLHTHSEFSSLDGLSTVEELVEQVKAQGGTALAVTDHGVCSGHPALQDACDKAGIKPIFGMEAYFVPDRHSRENHKDYQHLTLWAMNEEGLRNLWAISSEGYQEGFYAHPRVDWDTLTRLNGGVIASSGCLRGPLAEPYLRLKSNEALVNLSRFKEIFGDRYYIEIHVNQLEDQIKVNHWLVQQAELFDIPLIAAVDSHYATREDQQAHQVWLSVQTNSDVSQDSSLFGGGQDYHMMTESEVREALVYLEPHCIDRAIANTMQIANRCNARIEASQSMPVYSVGEDPASLDAAKMLDICIERWDERVKGKSKSESEYLARFERETDLLIRKGFPGYFLMVWDQVKHAKDNGILVGPGRGSGAASLVAYLMGITEVDPVENDLLFERFMTEGRTSLPDFDIDYPSSKKQYMLDYVRSRWGDNKVVSVGTHLRIKNKSAFRDTARAIKSLLPDDYYRDLDAISKLITEAEASTAGLGLDWDQLMMQAGDELEPYRAKMPELFKYAEKFRGRLKTYGRHAAGVIIDPNKSLVGAMPMFLSVDGTTVVSQWDMVTLDKLGYVKFDFLNLRTLDTIQETVDLIKKTTGDVIDVTKWRDEYLDPDVYEDICAGYTRGLFQIETQLGTRTTLKLKPRNLSELSDVITIGRPGPLRSGLADMYFRRRDGEEATTYPDERLEPILSKRYGCMLYQEDIMAVCLVLANYSSDEADTVRKILGKKKIEMVEKEGVKFVSRAVENDTSEYVSRDIWAQMAEFSRYSFNLAHAFAYATLAYWAAWLKHHYPVEFMTSCLSSVEKEDIPHFVAEARRMGYQVLPPDINVSGKGFTADGLYIRYGLDAVKGIGDAAMEAATLGQPYESWGDFLARKGPKCNAGHIKALAHVGAFDSLVPNRKALEARLEAESSGEAAKCFFWRDENNAWDLPCGFDWENEPAPIGRTGKPTKKKPPPKKCTKACRNYTPKDPIPDGSVEPYTDAEIRDIEINTLGIYLSSSPFDRIPGDVLSELSTAVELQAKGNGRYMLPIMIMSVRGNTTADGSPIRFMTANTPDGDLDMVVFSSRLDKYGESIRPGKMALVEVTKNDRGVSLELLEEI